MKVDGRSLGTCSICGAQSQYSWDGKSPPVLVKSGISLTAGDPTQLPLEVKRAVARLAKEHGVIPLSNQTGLEMKIVRAWVGAYCRGPKTDKPKPQLKERKKPGPKPKEKPEAHYAVPIPARPEITVGSKTDYGWEVTFVTRKPALAQVKRQRGRYKVYSY